MAASSEVTDNTMFNNIKRLCLVYGIESVKLAMNPWFYAAVLIQLLFWIILIVF
jgi:hypothetical protein